MPYSSIKDAPASWRKHKGASLTLAQINHLARIYDAVKNKPGIKNPAGLAWNSWEKVYKKKGKKWVKRKKDEEKMKEIVNALIKQEKGLRRRLAKVPHFTETVRIKWNVLTDFATEKAELEGLKVKGVAFTEGVFNGTFYCRKELEKAYKTLEGKELTIDHSDSVRAIIGKVTSVSYNAENYSVEFEGIITDEEIAEKIEQGLINSVSVELYVGDYKDYKDDEDEEVMTAVNIEFVALSLVRDPACEPPACGIETYENDEDIRGEKIMSDEEKETKLEVETEPVEPEKEVLTEEVQEPKAEPKVEPEPEKVEEEAKPEPESEPEVEPEPEAEPDSENLEDEIATLKKELSEKEEQLQEALSKLEEITEAENKKAVEEISDKIVDKEAELGKDFDKEERTKELYSKNKEELEVIWNAIKDIGNKKKEKKEWGKGLASGKKKVINKGPKSFKEHYKRIDPNR